MNREYLVVAFGVCLAMAVLIPAVSPGASPSSKEILEHVDDLFRGDSSYSVLSMTVKTRHYTRKMKLEGWTLSTEYSLIRILEPLKEKGTATLKADNNIWNYLPKVDRVIKVPSSMMGASWMGSHFTNDDLVKESRMSQDYDHQISFQGERNDIRVIELSLTPKPEAAVVWGKVVATVREADWIPLNIEYYGEKMDLKRTMTFSDITELGGRLLPATMHITPSDKPEEYTELTYQKIEFDIGLKKDFFSLRTLKNPEDL
ncbi:MAG: outer membrane lipoprotein-sorting protein [Thermovirgaceae bacterium]|nr:outer membrane lipoprotein-sorting protein [Thermovirgaceae bacterium]